MCPWRLPQILGALSRTLIPALFVLAGLTPTVAQLRPDTTEKTPLQPRPILQLLRFPATDPRTDELLDTSQHLLEVRRSPALAVNNAYSPAFTLFDLAPDDRLFFHGFNTARDGKPGTRTYNFLRPNQALTEISTNRWRALGNSQAGFQDNFDLRLLFASNFRHGLLWNFSYDREIYKGIYTHGKQRNTAFTTGLHFGAPGSKVSFNLLFSEIGRYREDNWGISSDTLLQQPQYSVREAVPVKNDLALTESNERSLGLNIHYNPSGQDVQQTPLLSFYAHLTSFKLKYGDAYITGDSILYGIYAIDSAIAMDFRQELWTMGLKARMFERHNHRLSANLNYENQFDLWGIPSERRQAIALGMEYAATPFPEWQLRTSGRLSVSGNKVYPSFKATADGSWMKKIGVRATLEYVDRPPPTLYRMFVLNDSIPFQVSNEMENIRTLDGSLILNFERTLRPGVRFHYRHYNRYHYLNANAQTASNDGSALVEVAASVKPALGPVDLGLEIQYRSMAPDSLGISGWSASGNVAFRWLFINGKGKSRIGLKATAAQYDQMLAFFPLLQQFHGTGVPGKFAYSAGAFAHFEIQGFRFNLDFENMESLWTSTRPMLVRSYPFYDFSLHMNIIWRFLN